jgi:DNA-directed RNA polymerase sigma subunit (sigma70/sigma32)
MVRNETKNLLDSEGFEDSLTYKILRKDVLKILHEFSFNDQDIVRCRFGLTDGLIGKPADVASRFHFSSDYLASLERTVILHLR